MDETHEMRELRLYIDNDAALYKQKDDFVRNMEKKMFAGKYDHALAPKLWSYYVKRGYDKYRKEFGPSSMKLSGAQMLAIGKEYADEEYEQLKKDGVGPHSGKKGTELLRKIEKASELGGFHETMPGHNRARFDSIVHAMTTAETAARHLGISYEMREEARKRGHDAGVKRAHEKMRK